jgi:uncharacterized protein (TIGR02145 family)
MARMIKNIVFLILVGIFVSCESDPELKALPTITTGNASSVSCITAAVSYTIEDNSAIKNAGVVWGTQSTLDYKSNTVNGSTVVGTHTINLSALSIETTIYYKAYVEDGRGNYLYGEVKTFNTTKVVLPFVTTSDLSDILGFAATGGGTIFLGSFAITERGVCYNTSGSPTINTNKISSGSGSGTYTSKLTGLTPNTNYYVRAYAIDSYGNCVYGAVKSFTTIQQETGTFTDARDNVTYKWVKIGSQIWMAENLRATKYNNGTSIPNVTNQTTWKGLTTGAYCYYSNNSSYSTTYGCLYNWYAVNTGKLAPAGWHVPTDAEWTILSTYLGGEDVAGGHLKSTTGWNSPNTGADNSSGFSALPGGSRYGSGFDNEDVFGSWWSSTVYNSYYACARDLSCYNAALGRNGLYFKYNGYSVRCVRDN